MVGKMIEGLWVVRFIAPGASEGELNGGVVVIETGRVFGGDSGYYYVGELGQLHHGKWPLSLRVHRHDPQIESVFGDLEDFILIGHLEQIADDQLGRKIIMATLREESGESVLNVKMTRVADLP